MAQFPEGPASSGAQNHGLRFMNEDWNESISNGHPFMLKWNESLEGIATELGVFRVAYPQDGMVVYELVSNITSTVNDAHCVWRPQDLEDELYALWLSAKGDLHPSWTISPPWRPKQTNEDNFRWAAPVGIPIVVILTLYALGVFTCLMYRRRKRAKERLPPASTPPGDAAGRHPSVDSEATAHTLTERDADGERARRKNEGWYFMDTPSGESRRPSDSTTSTTSMDRASEDTMVAGEGQWLQSLAQPGLPRVEEVWGEEVWRNVRRHAQRQARGERPETW